MRQFLFAILLLPGAPLAAQYIENPDFDGGGSTGWEGACWELGTGNPGYGLIFPGPGMGSSWEGCMACTPITGLMQDVPYEFSFWARKTGEHIYGMVSIMGFPPGASACPFTQEPQGGTQVPLTLLFNLEWTHLSSQFILPSDLPPDLNYFIRLSPSNDQDNGLGSILFDEFEISDLSTGVEGSVPSSPAFRPNPARDKLWVDVPDAPISIIAIEASGRSHALRSFQHNSRTLEVDVSALPPGMNVLRITLPSGNRTIRFIKT